MVKTDKPDSRRQHRWLRIMLLVIGLLLVGAPVAQAAGPCDLITDPTARGICEGVGSVIAPVPTIVGDIAGGSIVQPILQGIVRAEAQAVGDILLKMSDFLNTSTAPDFTASWFLGQYAIVLGLSVFLMFFTGFGRMAAGVKDKDVMEVGKAGGSMVTFLVAAPLIPLAMMGVIQVTDGPATQMFMNTAGSSLNELTSNVTAALATYNFTDAVLLPIIILLFGIIGGVITEIMLFFREAALYIFTAAEVVALAMWVGGRFTNDMFRRTTLSLIGLLLFKPIMAFTLVTGVGLLGSGAAAEPVLMGATLCLMVPFISWGAYKRIANHRFNEAAIWGKALSLTRTITRH